MRFARIALACCWPWWDYWSLWPGPSPPSGWSARRGRVSRGGCRVTFGVELDGAFRTCLLVLGIGLLLLVVGLVLVFFRRRKQPAPPLPVVAAAPVMPYSPPTYEKQGQIRRYAGLATGVVLLLAATGCVAVPEKNTSQSLSRPAVTLADGKAVVERYNEVNNKANQARDAKLSETIEGNPTLAQTRAGYRIDGKLDAAGKNKIKLFTYTKPRIGAPEFTSYPMRFVVSSGVSDDSESRQLGVWQRLNAGTPWVLTHSVYPCAATKLPSMEGLWIGAGGS
ncbi:MULTISPECIES: hypothetical protein [Kribbella]|nr:MULTISPECIES: hypothetical protein [Kribbella]